MARPRVHDENLRARLLDHAGRTVTENGMASLSLRALAAEAETSTTAVYSLFGGRSGLLTALYEEAFAGFGTSQRAVTITGDPVRDLTALGQAYWQWARQHPHLYGVMFSQALIGLEHTPQQSSAAQATIEPLAGVVHSAVRSGVLAGDPDTITFAVWAAVHGVVSLVLAGCAPDGDQPAALLFEATAEAVIRGWLARP
jgi:AcrR family transcriptional regulator